ncbi:MAG: adenylosuccinate synthase [Thermoanaerobaculaceae bacterium]|nr:adenylosuccinate synthase [Thermoanaerobaculaceae bacterium]
MANVVVVGGQWGDEGKGKVVDLLCAAFAHVVRFNGGANAGHTVRFADRHFALHLIPSGILHPTCRCWVGPGVVVDPVEILAEKTALEQQGVGVASRLTLSPRAHLVLPGHRALDHAREQAKGHSRIGTTGRGIGPTYETRAARTGVRLGLARTPKRLRDAVAATTVELERLLSLYPGSPVPPPEAIEEAIEAALRLAPLVGDVSRPLFEAASAGEPILFEGAQGTFLDVDHGTYPFVTSSGCLAGYAAPACGLPAKLVHGVLGVFKAYTTRVGGGPFPTELSEALGEHVRRRGNEFGTTTGRPRRTGWFDAVAARAAVRWNGIEAMALTKLDVLDELDEVRVAVAYRLGGEELQEPPDDVTDVTAVEPIYESFPGWKTSTAGCSAFEELPSGAQAYVRGLEAMLGIPAVLVSTGPRREETILRAIEPLSRWCPPLTHPR